MIKKIIPLAFLVLSQSVSAAGGLVFFHSDGSISTPLESSESGNWASRSFEPKLNYSATKNQSVINEERYKKDAYRLTLKSQEDSKAIEAEFSEILFLSETKMGLSSPQFLSRLKGFNYYLMVKVEIEILRREMERLMEHEIDVFINNSMDEEFILVKHNKLDDKNKAEIGNFRTSQQLSIQTKWNSKIDLYNNFESSLDFLYSSRNVWSLSNGQLAFTNKGAQEEYDRLRKN